MHVKPGGVRVINGVTPGVPGVRDILELAVVDVVSRESPAAKLLGRFNDSSRQPHLNVPLNVAVEEVDSRVSSPEAENSVRVGHHMNDVAHRRHSDAVASFGPRTGITARSV